MSKDRQTHSDARLREDLLYHGSKAESGSSSADWHAAQYWEIEREIDRRRKALPPGQVPQVF